MRRSRRLTFSRLIFLLLITALLVLSIIIRQYVRQRPHPGAGETAGEARVIDGDTFVDSAGRKIRLLGIDTPEKGEPYYQEAKLELAELISGRRLKYELGSESTDRYGRLLAFIFVDDTLFVNARLLEEGLARAYFFEENISASQYGDRLCGAQREAFHQHKGIWSLKIENPSDRYFGNQHTLRFHRPSCSAVERGDTTTMIRSTDRNFFINNCYSPCRNCKP